LGTNYRRRGVLVSLRGYRLSHYELASLAEEQAAGGLIGMRSRVDPAIRLVATSQALDRANDRLRLIRFDGRPPATDLPPRRGGARWP